MIYPRAKSTNNALSQAPSNRKGFTNQQKDELRKQIADRLSKKFGINMTEFINGKVGDYLQNNQNITVEGLQQLENDIKQASNNQNNEIQINNNQQDDEDAKSGKSKMSGASNFDRVDQYTKKIDRKETDENSSKYRTQKLGSLQTKKVENDLGFLNEENQWAAIYKYNKFLYDKESEIQKYREVERKKRIKEELDQQVQEKQKRKEKQKLEEDAFYKNQIYQCEQFDRREAQRLEELRRLKMIEKEGRDHQIKENKKHKRSELRQEKILDTYMIQKVRQEMEEESNFQQMKKEHQYQVMQKLMEENEERKKKATQEQEAERLENVKLMDAYCHLLDQQEQERERAIKERDIKIKEYQKRALEMQEQDLNSQKIGQLERRAMKYEERKEKKIQEYEKSLIENKKNQKLQTREYLNKQMTEKQIKRQEEKQQDQEQAKIWQNDNERFFEWEKNINGLRKQTYKEYQETLKDQMKERQEHKKAVLEQMSQHEQMLNNRTLKELETLKQVAY